MSKKGFTCDRCGETISEEELRTDNFKINYTIGYGTQYDGETIVAQICDNCLMDIVKKEIPHAKIIT